MATAKLPDNQGGGRLLARSKSNIGPDGGGFKYELEQVELSAYPGVIASVVQWGEVLEGSARDLLGQAEKMPETDDDTAKGEAKAWLAEALRYGDIDGKQIKIMAREAGISERTLYRAVEDLGVKTLSGGFSKPRIWHLCAMCAIHKVRQTWAKLAHMARKKAKPLTQAFEKGFSAIPRKLGRV